MTLPGSDNLNKKFGRNQYFLDTHSNLVDSVIRFIEPGMSDLAQHDSLIRFIALTRNI